MTRNSQAPRREPTAQDLMQVCLRAYFTNTARFFVPDHAHDTEGFTEAFTKWRTWSTMCDEEQHLDAQQGSVYCSLDSGHNSPHYGGGLEVTTPNTNNDPGMVQ